MNLLRRVYLELRYNSLMMFVLATLAAWLLEQIANYTTGQTTIQFWQWESLLQLARMVSWMLVAILIIRAATWLWNRLRARSISLGTPPSQYRGVILVFGRETTARMALAHHRDRLEFIWFILTEQTKSEFEKLPPNWWGRAALSFAFVTRLREDLS